MMKKFKREFSLLRYAYAFRTNLVFAVLFVLLGIFLQLTSRGMTIVGGYFLVVMAPIYLGQMHSSMAVFDFVSSAPWKRQRQILFPAVTSGVMFAAFYLVFAGIVYLQARALPEYREMLYAELWGVAVLAAICEIYLAVVFKQFFLSVVIMALPMMGIISMFSISVNMMERNWNGGMFFLPATFGFIPVTAMGLALIAVAGALSYGVRALMYKQPFSRYSQVQTLRRQLRG